jgi:prevent-host-death family protein
MRSIGVRELRQQASRYLRDVERGETIEVTDRGRPLALLVPIPTSSTIERLSAEGRLAPSRGDLLELGPPLPPLSGVAPASQALADDREHGR